MNLIEVTVIVFPDGKTCWMEYKHETEQEDIREQIEAWKEANHEKYDNTGVDMAVCNIRMLEEDYNNIKAPFIP